MNLSNTANMVTATNTAKNNSLLAQVVQLARVVRFGAGSGTGSLVLESAAWFTAQKEGQHEVSTNAPCNAIPEPDLDLHWFLAASPVNYSRHKDMVIDDLYTKQSRATDPEERRRLLRAFEKRLYDEEVHFIHTFQWYRIVPHAAKVRGWTITPSHYLNQQLDTVWLSE